MSGVAAGAYTVFAKTTLVQTSSGMVEPRGPAATVRCTLNGDPSTNTPDDDYGEAELGRANHDDGGGRTGRATVEAMVTREPGRPGVADAALPQERARPRRTWPARPRSSPSSSSRPRGRRWAADAGAFTAGAACGAARAGRRRGERDAHLRPDSLAKHAAPGTPVTTSLGELQAAADKADAPIYWAGTRPGDRFELTRTRRGKPPHVRYLPPGVKAGDKRAATT